MKFSVLTSFVIFFLILLQTQSNAQCIVDLGDDIVQCYGDSTALHIEIVKGVAPYSYKWEASHVEWIDTLFASHFLNDTTLANVVFYAHIGIGDAVELQLTVRDASNNLCRDSIIITESWFGATLGECTEDIIKGDTTLIYSTVFGGLSPLKYFWTPTVNTQQFTSDGRMLVWPDTTTLYRLTIIDSAGCVNTLAKCEIFVEQPTGLNNHSDHPPQINIFPNPLTSSSILTISNFSNFNELSLEIYDVLGQSILSDRLKSSEYNLGSHIRRSGMYHYMLFDKGTLIFSGKLLKE